MFNDKDQQYRYEADPRPNLSLISVTIASALLSESYKNPTVKKPIPLQNYDVYSAKRLVNNWQTCLDKEINSATKNDQYKSMLHSIFMHIYSHRSLEQIEHTYMRTAKAYLVKFFSDEKLLSDKDLEQIEELIRQVFPKLFI
jgi:hypothetical protein